ncbi:translation elongation factor Ts [Flavobacteriaceae bacterium]|nr:translation elongation factor Ts [Flavobacteriaceae bacterium]
MSIKLIKQLREKTGCPMGDCNKAIKECDGDLEKAVDWLRKKGLASAAKKSSRATSEGIVGIVVGSNKASIIEINSETDFVAKNDKFQTFAKNILEIANESDIESLDDLNSKKYLESPVVISEEVKNQISIIGENINLTRLTNLKIENGVIVSYVHNTIGENLGKIAVLVSIETDSKSNEVKQFGKQIAMHIAASRPESLSIDLVDKEKLDRETDILKDQARASKKPESIIDKMVQGRIKKYYSEVVLLEQNFVLDDKIKVGDAVENFAKANNCKLIIKDFKIFVLGER